ncbi:uncharacterized protein LOC105804623 isoform X2 [Gossypium raimondii]|nr:uncharacterized protein LOC105804623 isoform X2 [Gossypium raimondii]
MSLEIPSARLPSSIFFSTSTSGADPPQVRHRSTSGPPRLHPFPESEVSHNKFSTHRFQFSCSSTTMATRMSVRYVSCRFSSGSGKILSEEEKAAENIYIQMPHRTRPMTALLVFTGLNAVLVSTITPVYDFVCFLPFWERRRERRRLERETSSNKFQSS